MPEKLEVGNIVEGKVIRIKPFGAIIALDNNIQGLVHISQIANNFVQDINDHVKIGDIVKVKVLSIDKETNKIALSIKDTIENAVRPKQKVFEHKQNYENRLDTSDSSKIPLNDFEEKMKDWLKQANECQAGLNKRANRR